MLAHRLGPLLLPPLSLGADPALELESQLEPSTSRVQRSTPIVTSAGASDFEFDETTAAGATRTGWRVLQARLEQEGIHVSGGWTENHYRWIVWKLACQQRSTVLAGQPAQEDDAFEEIEQQEWTETEQDSEDAAMWQDGWEDDDDDDQYTQQLRAELETSDAAAPSARSRPPAFSPETVLRQMRERHALESRGQRTGHLPVVRKVLERWPEVGEGAHMVPQDAASAWRAPWLDPCLLVLPRQTVGVQSTLGRSGRAAPRPSERPRLRPGCPPRANVDDSVWASAASAFHLQVLCVAGVDEAKGTIELTDGWYSAWAGCDEPLRMQLARHACWLRVGSKLRVSCTEWKGDPDPDTPLWHHQQAQKKGAVLVAPRLTALASWGGLSTRLAAPRT